MAEVLPLDKCLPTSLLVISKIRLSGQSLRHKSYSNSKANGVAMSMERIVLSTNITIILGILIGISVDKITGTTAEKKRI